MADHQPQPDNSDRVAQPEPERHPLDGLDAETIEDLVVDEDAEDVKGGYSGHLWCPTMPPCGMTQ